MSDDLSGPLPVVLLNDACRWQTAQHANYILHYTGSGRQIAQQLHDKIIKTSAITAEIIDEILKQQRDFSSGIFICQDTVIAWVDHIRSFPVFYSINKNDGLLANDPRLILSHLDQPTMDQVALLEFCMTGFITGRDTLYQDIKCLQPGELMMFSRAQPEPIIHRYDYYLPSPTGSGTRAENIAQLGVIIDALIKKIINRADNRPIWVPLSGGLDSRIILCKLHEHGYKNLHTFTYGPKFNFEAIYARRIAKKLGVPWHYIGLTRRQCHGFFHDPTRVAYSAFADGLKAAPSLREYTALKWAKDQHLIPDNAIIINGQSGDYLTGGHVAPFWFGHDQVTPSDLYKIILDKHYTLWNTLDTPVNRATMTQKIETLLAPEQDMTPFMGAAYEEAWEYDARQITLVVNGQRSYDFFGYAWELPLWEKDLCDLFLNIPYDQKRGQSLFKEYLQRYNYQGLFPGREPKIWRWPIPMLWVLPVGKIMGWVGGTTRKKQFYALLRYFGHYSNQYAFFPFRQHVQTYQTARNIFSLYVRHWFVENKFHLPSILRHAMKIDHAEQ